MFLKPNEPSVSGEEMTKRAKELNANLGQRHAEILFHNQHLIPKEWRNKPIVFPGTVWRDPDFYRRVSYLYWREGSWYLDFIWHGWISNGRLLRVRHRNST